MNKISKKLKSIRIYLLNVFYALINSEKKTIIDLDKLNSRQLKRLYDKEKKQRMSRNDGYLNPTQTESALWNRFIFSILLDVEAFNTLTNYENESFLETLKSEILDKREKIERNKQDTFMKPTGDLKRQVAKDNLKSETLLIKQDRDVITNKLAISTLNLQAKELEFNNKNENNINK